MSVKKERRKKKTKLGLSRLTLHGDGTKLLAGVVQRFAGPDLFLVTVNMTH